MMCGRLDRQITLQQPSTSRNSYGEETTTWSDYATVWAAVIQQGAREVFSAGKVAEVDAVFKIRYLSAVDSTWRITYDNDTYEIVGKPKELGRQDGLEITTRSQT